MKTMNAFWRYDWTRNRGWYVTIWALVVLGVLAVWAAKMGRGTMWAAPAVVVLPASVVAVPLLLVRGVIELGRIGSPRQVRHFVHTMPVDRSEWALAKLLGAVAYLLGLPLLLLVAGGFLMKFTMGVPFGLKPAFFVFLCALLAGTIWTMLWSALLPHRWVLLGIPVFVVGECLARGVTSLESQQTGVAKTLLASSLDMGLLVLLAVLLGGVFVRYHQRRSRVWALIAAFIVLGGVDGVRALVWWLVRTGL